MAASNGLISQHKDRVLGISVNVERSHQYVRGNKQTPSSNYSINAYVSVPLEGDKRPIDEILKDPKVVSQIMDQLQARLLEATQERDSFVQD